jgi:hypothetical protein
MPLFVFLRRPDIEREGGFTLAGQLIVDIRKRQKLNKKQSRLIRDIVQFLVERVRNHRVERDMMVGWDGGARPDNAADIDDDELMAAWAKRSTVIVVRVDPRNDDVVRVDSDLRRQMGLGEESDMPF